MGLLCYLHLVRYVSLFEEVLHECEEAAGRERRHEQVFAQPPRHRVRSFPQITLIKYSKKYARRTT